MKFKKWPVAAALLILLAVTLGILLEINWPASFFQEKILKKSTAQVFIDQDKLYLQFAITPPDQAVVERFTNDLGWSDQWLKGISLSLDQVSQDRLAVSLPAQLILHFTDRSLSFKSHNLSLARPVISQREVRLATGSSKLEFKAGSVDDYYLEVIDPVPLLSQATISGVVSLSQKAEPLFLSLAKIAKITVRVDGKYIEGEVILK